MRRPLTARTRALSSTLGSAVALAALLGACGDLKNAADGDSPPGSSSDGSISSESSLAGDGASGRDSSPPTDGRDASDASFPDGRGPGPYGSLPSGYCCNADSECRYRRCVDTGGGAGKMCLDECFQQIFCTRPDITFTCTAPDGGVGRSLCQPPSGFACIPAAQFVRGTDPIGACCNAPDPANADGTAASHCEGNQCASVGEAPLVCVHRCSFAQDCPSGFACTMFGTSKACVPTTSTYTCK